MQLLLLLSKLALSTAGMLSLRITVSIAVLLVCSAITVRCWYGTARMTCAYVALTL
jgi:hypothetical protein